jgi:hypothetical protein
MSSQASTFYCRPCATGRGLLAGLHAPSTAPSPYQIRKARKRIQSTPGSTGLQSLLRTKTTSHYDDLAKRTFANGFLEIEPDGRRSLVYQTTGVIGDRFKGRRPIATLDSFRWVLSTGVSLAHGRPVSSTEYAGEECAGCDGALISREWSRSRLTSA